MSLCHQRGQRMFGCVVTGRGTAMITVGYLGVGSVHALVMSSYSLSGYRARRDGNFSRAGGRMISVVAATATASLIEKIHLGTAIAHRVTVRKGTAKWARNSSRWVRVNFLEWV